MLVITLQIILNMVLNNYRENPRVLAFLFMKDLSVKILLVLGLVTSIFGVIFSQKQQDFFSANAIARLQIIDTAQGNSIFGTGFFIQEDLLITNQHVVEKVIENPNRYQVYGCVKKNFRGVCNSLHYVFEVVSLKNNNYDLALLKIARAKHLGEWKNISEIPKKRHVVVEKFSSATDTKTLTAIGYPTYLLGRIAVNSGTITGELVHNGHNFLITNIDVLPGNSGGPIFDENGNIIGVITACVSLDGKECIQGTNLFIPIDQVSSWFNQNTGTEFFARD